jgi:hypothetical protein
LTCTTLGPTPEATRATGSSAGIREGDPDEVWIEAPGEPLAEAASFSWDTGCLFEHPASTTKASRVASKKEHPRRLRFNVPEPPEAAFR